MKNADNILIEQKETFFRTCDQNFMELFPGVYVLSTYTMNSGKAQVLTLDINIRTCTK